MNRQILLRVETNKKADTDYVYIVDTIRHFYKDDIKISYKPVYMGSKSKYKDKGTTSKINQYRKGFPGQTNIIYFIDYDRADIDYLQNKDFQTIREYCLEMGYDFVYFYRDIEDVYLGKQVPDSQKVRMAAQFRTKGIIRKVREDSLSTSALRQHNSNILLILDKYFERS